MDIEMDLDTFFDTSEFAVVVTLPGGTIIKGIFDNEYKLINLQDGEINTTAPQVVCKSSDVSGIVLGNTLTIKGISYTVIERQPDGTGLTTLILSLN